MTRAMKFVLLGLGLAGAIILFLLLKPPSDTADYTIKDGRVTGELAGRFKLTLDAEIIADYTAEYSVGKGVRADYLSHRVEILENIYGSIEGIKVITSGLEGYVISNVDQLMDYVQTRQEVCTAPENTPYDITPEDWNYGETYLKDNLYFTISHRDNEATMVWFDCGELSTEEQIEKLREFARMLKMEAYFDFDKPIYTEQGIIIPIRVDGIPIIAWSYDYLLDKNEEAYVLQYLGYDNMHMGLRCQFHHDQNDLSIHSVRPVLPVSFDTEKHPVITAQQAIEALKANLDSIYIDNRVPQGQDFTVNKIQLAYAAVYGNEGSYTLQPVYVFVNNLDLDWDRCFFVDAITGEVFPAIDTGYAFGVLNPNK